MMSHKAIVGFLVTLLLTAACGGQSAATPGAQSPSAGQAVDEAAEAPAQAPAAPGAPPSAVPEAQEVQALMAQAADTGPAEPPARTPTADGARADAPGAGSGTARTPAEVTTPRQQMLEIEGTLVVEVPDVDAAVHAVRQVAKKFGAQITSDETQRGKQVTAQLTLRVPTVKVHEVLPGIERLGHIVSRQIKAADVTKQYLDASLRLRNLELTLARYEQLLARANTVQEMLVIEQHITRVRGQIEQIKGQLRYMRDRVARATLHISLRHPEEEEPLLDRPEAKFFPGLRLGYANDFWRKTAPGSDTLTHTDMWSLGLAVGFTRHTSLDVDVLRGVERDAGGIDGVLLTVGGRLYSDFLGAGRRQTLEPYLNYRVGYARLRGNNEAVVGGGLGLDIFKNNFVTISADGRFFVLFASDIGAHGLVQPVLEASVGF